jgi:hypothetical protein
MDKQHVSSFSVAVSDEKSFIKTLLVTRDDNVMAKSTYLQLQPSVSVAPYNPAMLQPIANPGGENGASAGRAVTGS